MSQSTAKCSQVGVLEGGCVGRGVVRFSHWTLREPRKPRGVILMWKQPHSKYYTNSCISRRSMSTTTETTKTARYKFWRKQPPDQNHSLSALRNCRDCQEILMTLDEDLILEAVNGESCRNVWRNLQQVLWHPMTLKSRNFGPTTPHLWQTFWVDWLLALLSRLHCDCPCWAPTAQ